VLLILDYNSRPNRLFPNRTKAFRYGLIVFVKLLLFVGGLLRTSP